MLLVTLGLLLGGAALLWCFVLALTFGDQETKEAAGFHARLSPSSVEDRHSERLASHRSLGSRDSQELSEAV